jgi:hypothetical protein
LKILSGSSSTVIWNPASSSFFAVVGVSAARFSNCFVSHRSHRAGELLLVISKFLEVISWVWIAVDGSKVFGLDSTCVKEAKANRNWLPVGLRSALLHGKRDESIITESDFELK